MNSLIHYLWLILALPLLAVGLSASAGAERRQPVAHGVSRGIRVHKDLSSVGAKEPAGESTAILSPLRGLFDPDISSHGLYRRIKVHKDVKSEGAAE